MEDVGRGSSASTTQVPEVSHVGSSLPGICAVEVPGRVVDIEEAVASIGGPVAVQQAMKQRDGKLRLRLCRQYKFQAPLPMQRHRTSNLLVRATRLSSGAWHCQPVGIVHTAFKAEVLADFLFVPGAELNYGASPVMGSIEEELSDVRPPAAPFMPPAFFTRVDTPQAYNFEDNAFIRRQSPKEVKAITGTQEAKLKRAWIQVSQVKFADQGPVPSTPPDGAEEQLREDEKPVVEALRLLFSERSIWLRGPLEERLHEQRLTPNVTTMQKSLLCVSYLCSDGPWRQAYARLGFDPRLQPEEARWLQVIDFRDRFLKQRRAYFERIQGTLDALPVPALDCHFRTPPVNRSQLYQLVDIEDEVIQQVLSSCGCIETVSEKFGWMPQTSLEAVRERMSVKAELMHRSRATGPSALEAPERVLALPAAAAAEQVARGRTKRRLEWTGPQHGLAVPQDESQAEMDETEEKEVVRPRQRRRQQRFAVSSDAED
eukprot:TRINITY_DN19909_c0_g1_i1.p1 TRINITY_DN19909_c0_g1~~TRINITY_DN19909_c0_g1_i1.p1  ORF type:complete len:487 (+),score=86.78 TRINITY_DN19909_c0_g1_i1:206-1666(+)